MDGEDLLTVMQGVSKRSRCRHVFQTGWHVGANFGFGYQLYDDADNHWFYGYNINSGDQELYNMSQSDPVNVFDDPQYKKIRQRMINTVAQEMQSDKRWFGYWCTYRLHNAEFLRKADGDMQMFVPKKH